ncbi:SMC-Scp complex subunit ScpB [Alkalilimnicola ehrlichii]|uniref:SMC-Scp complex subunit ScpB n=1 Tax=Alkalilimnicola ehrlichii TaxID=351052 RepID=A0A3E0WXM8_9GAMM|nr:SMC-Scp complex subunit ScpB [Alkalilimnicola ehrlichii]RFA27745.1 SMC-Scp complex subunit ScpB [Alkalilimnicola ehrlichii]RFA36921.1 SMC-Scp complex subunit ScpB [Alkalilimnicola ehrlichii]
MAKPSLKNIIEGALLAVGEPLSIDRLRNLFPDSEMPEREAVKAALAELEYDYRRRGIELKEVASGFRIQVRDELSPWVSRLWEERPSRYSRALLETLAIIAYRQPVTRAEIEDIRGVSVSSNIMRTLQEREWVRVIGHRDVPGRPAMFGTTRKFLDYFNLKNLDDLPSLIELRDLEEIHMELDLKLPEEVPAAEGSETEADVPAQEDDPV